MKRFFITSGLAWSLGLALSPLPLEAAPQWIWVGKQAKDGEKATFRKTFTVSGSVTSAKLQFTCDNGSTAYLNGTKVAENPDWGQPTKTDVGKFLKAGDNELRFEAKNEGTTAGFVAILEVVTADGKKSLIESGPDWSAAPAGSTDFKPAEAIAAYGAGPWGKALANAGSNGAVPEAADIQLVPGFSVELLYTVPKAEQGSWVTITEDP